MLNDPARTILGADQSAWLSTQLAASRDRGATWQFIGQQVLMGKLMIPNITEEQLAAVELPEYTREWIGAMVKLAPLNFPMNLDAWDGYPACRERVFAQFVEQASNPVVVAGDTHNGWAFNLANANGEPVGVEIGCPGISSPGIETYLPLPPATMAEALQASSAELVALDTHRRGWAEVTLTPQETLSRWHFVSTVLSREFTVESSETLRCKAGARRFS